VRGDIWQPTATTPTGLAAWLEVSADALVGGPTVTVTAITTEPVDGLGWPLAIPVPDELLGRPAWIRTTHIHTITRAELGQHAGRLPIAVIRRTDDALRRVLGLTTVDD
jgi:mRNA-degrading endonuclease toxin of MazEF toxin-antitoxin module